MLVLVLVVLATATRVVAVAATTTILEVVSPKYWPIVDQPPVVDGGCMHGGACSTRSHLRLVMVSMSVSSTDS